MGPRLPLGPWLKLPVPGLVAVTPPSVGSISLQNGALVTKRTTPPNKKVRHGQVSRTPTPAPRPRAVTQTPTIRGTVCTAPRVLSSALLFRDKGMFQGSGGAFSPIISHHLPSPPCSWDFTIHCSLHGELPRSRRRCFILHRARPTVTN